MLRTHQHRTCIFGRRAFLLLLVSLLALLGLALSAGAFPGERFPSGFDRGKVFAEFASRVDGSLAEIRERRAPNALRPAGASKESAAARLEGGYGRFPLLFVKNEGQSAPEVAFTVHGSDKTLYFTPEGLAFSLLVPRETKDESRGAPRLDQRLEEAGKPVEEREAPRERWTLKLGFVNAERVRPEGERPAETVISYFKGPKNEHRSGVPAYNSIVYRDLWPGIDLVYDGDASHLKYRFVVRPGADPKRIRLAYRGAGRLSADAGGGLEIVTTAGVLRDAAPVAWQETEEGRVTVRAAYALGRSEAGSGEGSLDAALDYGFSVGGYDPTKELIIDPVVLVYCGCIGGSGEDVGTGVAVDGSGFAYVTGHTASGEGSFPEKVGPDRFYNGGAFDAFVAKVNAAGTDLEYCGYIGGLGKDEGFGIAVDASGNAYVTGRTSSSTDFPVPVGPDFEYNGGDFDAFVAKVNALGTDLIYCGYIGGSNGDTAEGIAVDASGNAYVTGSTASEQGSFPVTEGPDASYNGGPSDVFVAKVNADGSGLAYCGYIGGTGDDFGSGIAVDDWYFAYVTGYTSSTEANGFPVIAWPDNSHKGGYFDVFAAKVNADGSGLAYCGYIGGTNADTAEGIAVDGVGCAYVTGGTASTKANAFPVTEEGMDDSYNGGSSDAFVAKVNAAGTGLTYCGYIGGTGNDAGSGIAVDGAGCAYMTGSTTSTNFPVSGDWPYSTYNGGSSDAFAAKVNAAGSGLEYCGYIGGTGQDEAYGIAVDAWGNAYVTGYTGSANFPVVAGWPDSSYKGGGFFDAFAAKITSHTGSVRVTITGPAEARWSVDGAGSYVSGQTVPGVPVGVNVVSFSDVAGWDTPSDQNVVVSEDVTTETSGTYIRQEGSVRVTIVGPAEARWSLNGAGSHASGQTVPSLQVGSYVVSFLDVAGWNTPSDQNVVVSEDVTTETSGTYIRQEGSVCVTIVGPAEARWRLNGAGNLASGESVSGVPVGVNVVSFSDVAGWDTPSDQNVVVSEDVTTETSGTYTATSTPTATPTPTPTPDPDPDPTPTPPPTPTPTPLPPVEPPVVPPDTPLPEGSRPSVPTPLVVTLPPNPTPEQKRDALWKVLSEALVPDERIESIIDLLTIDDAGRVYITEEGMERLGELLDDIDIPEGAEGSPLAVFRAVLDAQGSALTASDGVATAIVFFRIPEGFIGKRSDRLQVVKEISSKIAEAFERVYTLEDLRDGCAAVVEVETAAGVETLKRVLEADERISANCLVALAIKDGGRFDLDEKENGGVTDPAFIVEGVKKSDPDDPDGPSGSGGGCTAGGFSRTLLALFAPLVLLAGGRKRR